MLNSGRESLSSPVDLSPRPTNGRHVAVLTSPVAGHVYSILGLCSELVKRGYRVTCPMTDRYAQLIRETGAEPLRLTATGFKPQQQARGAFDLPPMDPDWWKIVAPGMFRGMIDFARWILPELEHLYEGGAPDLVLCDRHFFAARLLAKRLHSPAVQICAAFALYQNTFIREHGVCVTPEPIPELAREVDEFFREHGITEKNNLWPVEELNIYFVPKEFQYEDDWFDERWCFVGACIDRPFEKTWKNNSQGKPIILITNTSGTSDSSYFKKFVEVFGGSEYHVIFSIGSDLITAESLGTLPENFEINRSAQHVEILPYTVLAICQGGMGNTLEPLYYGVPVIAIPAIPIHDEIAYRVAELGLGSYLPANELTVETIRDHVKNVLGNKEILSKVQEMQARFRRAGGAKLAADRIEEFLASAARFTVG